MRLTAKAITAELHRLGHEACGWKAGLLPRPGASRVARQDREGSEGEQPDAGGMGGRVCEVEEAERRFTSRESGIAARAA
jgi:hypothetical protein